MRAFFGLKLEVAIDTIRKLWLLFRRFFFRNNCLFWKYQARDEQIISFLKTLARIVSILILVLVSKREIEDTHTPVIAFSTDCSKFSMVSEVGLFI